ncbi:hypothetical protein QQ25_06975 [Mycolicibacterium setense]|nr:hypothetical protein QQ25_06975 [Mycolicibacterium setense]
MLLLDGQRRDSRRGSPGWTLSGAGIDVGARTGYFVNSSALTAGPDRKHQSIDCGVPGLNGSRYREVSFVDVRDCIGGGKAQLVLARIDGLPTGRR